ncbi:hypothetical protein [uncultured Bacteroides sp.]|uniref:hypothetical protein n=1 Tax=uncultured Bacteroides sp. TaxID=162156 RepID=UPI002AABB345|nr:hypothetical protein [uncultured Bacteroides sp.]
MPLLILSIILYIIGKRISSILIFFFFLFDGFQLIPEMLFDTHVGISKSVDFAFVYILVLFIYGFIRFDDFIPKNRISKLIAIYLSFIIICIGISLFYYHISFVDILRTSRTYFLLLSYFVIRRLENEELVKLLKILFIIVLFQCCLFIIQAFTGIALLVGGESGRTGVITRFYSVPFMLYFLVFYAIFCNPYQGWLRVVTTVIPFVTMFLPLHRSLMMAFIVCALIGIYIKIGGLKVIMKYPRILCVIIIPILFIVAKSAQGRTVTDISNVLSGEFLEVNDDFVMDEDSTFLFRMTHFFERFMDITDSKMGSVFGAGYMTEGSDYTLNHFDYQIGLPDEITGNTIQLDTSDISWSNFIIRYGIIGTFIFLYFFFSITSIYNKNLKTIGLPIFLYMILLFIDSFTSDLMYQNRMLIFPLLLYNLLSSKYEYKKSIDNI